MKYIPIKYGNNYFYSLAFGAELWLGKIAHVDDTSIPARDKLVFQFKGYFGFSATNPQHNYLYLERTGTDLTLEKMLDAFDSGVDKSNMPKPLRESGFYGRTIFAYSANPVG